MNSVTLTPVVSSNIAAWGYDSGILVVEFKSGSKYQYIDVPPNVVAQMSDPGVSIGSFISNNIRGVFSCAPVVDEAVQDE